MNSFPSDSRKVLVFCWGNVCRSPMAQVLLQKHLGSDWQVDSAGTSPNSEFGHADPNSRQTLQHHGLELLQHTPQALTPQLAAQYDWILGMDKFNLSEARKILPESQHKKLAGFDAVHEVPDPYGQPIDGFEAVFQQLEAASLQWAKNLKSNQ